MHEILHQKEQQQQYYNVRGSHFVVKKQQQKYYNVMFTYSCVCAE